MLQAALDAIGFGLCHQIPERSFFGAAVRVPVCARDTGIYVGFAIAFVVLVLVQRNRPSQVPPLWVNVLLGLGVVAMAVDGVTSYAGLRPTTNELRLLTGLFTGYAIAAWVMPILAGELWQRPGDDRVLGGVRPAVLYLLSLVVAYAFTWWVAPALGILYPLAVTAAIITTFTVVNLVIVSLLPPFNRRAGRFADTLPALGVALALTVIELAASSYLKAVLLSIAV